MKSKLMLVILSMAVSVSLLAGCASKTPTTTAATTAAKTDTVSGASQATDNSTFEQKIGKDGNYIIITNKDLTFTKDLTVEGTFTKKDKNGNTVTTRSLAFGAKSEDGKVTARYSVTVPNLVIKSGNTLLEVGIVKGDIYVQAPGFRTSDATIDGNLYFATQELKDAFCADDKTKITGKIDVKLYTK
jgi:outer membrane murein-binding lipoprotein Lpp